MERKKKIPLKNDTGKKKTRQGKPDPGRQPRKAEPEKVRQEAERPLRDVVYLPPKPFNKNKLLLQIATVAAVVLAFVLGVSVFFKIDEAKITVCGNVKYSAWDIRVASKIEDKENLLTFSRASAAAKIRAALPYVKHVRIGIRLPDQVIIEVQEVEVTYAVKAQDNNWWLVSSTGKVIELAQNGIEESRTKILGVQLLNPMVGQNASALEPVQTGVDKDGQTLPVAVKAAKKLSIALEIATNLERNGIIGQAKSIDVNDTGALQLWYGDRFHVKLGDEIRLNYKIGTFKSIITAMKDYESGMIDISNPDKVLYDPFE